MHAKLIEIKNKFDEIEKFMADGDYLTYAKEHKKLLPVIEAYNNLVSYESDLIAAKELNLIEEIENAKIEIEKVTAELEILLMPRDERDDSNVIMEIRPAAGGDEAALFAAALLRMYTMYATAEGFSVEINDINETEIGGVKEVSISIIGDGAFSRFKYESGVHRVQRVPDTETQGRIHTSTCTVAVLPEAVTVDFKIDEKDLKIDTYRAGGAGGQHVNKTESAIRITHIPSGIIVQCQNERSQIQNRDRAMKMLQSKLYLRQREEHMEKLTGIRGETKDNAWGSQIRSYVFHPYSLVKDHRTDEETGNLQAVMDGGLDPFMNAYLIWDHKRTNQ